MLESFFQSLPGLLLQLRGMENAEPTACQLMEVMCHSSSKLLTDALEQHMEQLLGKSCWILCAVGGEYNVGDFEGLRPNAMIFIFI